MSWAVQLLISLAWEKVFGTGDVAGIAKRVVYRAPPKGQQFA